MVKIENVKVLATELDANNASVLIAFREAQRATNTWRFKHTRYGTLLRIFADADGLPIAVEFTPCEKVELSDEQIEQVSPESMETAIQKLYGFAIYMIERAQLALGTRLIQDAVDITEDQFPSLISHALQRAKSVQRDFPQTVGA